MCCVKVNIRYYYLTEFVSVTDAESWTAVDLRGTPIPVRYDADLQIIECRGQGGEFIYFLAPGKIDSK